MKGLIPWKSRQSDNAPALWDDSWIGRMWDEPFLPLPSVFSGSMSTRLPSVDVDEDRSEYRVRAEVPGMDEKDLDLSWHEGILRIRGEKKTHREEKNKGRYYRECSYGTFARDIPLGNAVDWKRAQAKYRNGVLTVKLPKSENPRKAIEIPVN